MELAKQDAVEKTPRRRFPVIHLEPCIPLLVWEEVQGLDNQAQRDEFPDKLYLLRQKLSHLAPSGRTEVSNLYRVRESSTNAGNGGGL